MLYGLKDKFLPENDAERVVAVRNLRLLDTPREDRFDRITSMLCKIFDVPISIITLVDEERVWGKSVLSGTHSQMEVKRTESACSLTILHDELTVIENALLDPRMEGSPFVSGDYHMRFYAGAPLRTPDGFRVGSVCLVDRKPRSFSEYEQALLSDFARLVQHELVRPAEESRQDVRAESCKVDGEIVTVCAWTNRIFHQGKWIPSGHYLHQHLGMQVTHGMAEDFSEDFLGE